MERNPCKLNPTSKARMQYHLSRPANHPVLKNNLSQAATRWCLTWHQSQHHFLLQGKILQKNKIVLWKGIVIREWYFFVDRNRSSNLPGLVTLHNVQTQPLSNQEITVSAQFEFPTAYIFRTQLFGRTQRECLRTHILVTKHKSTQDLRWTASVLYIDVRICGERFCLHPKSRNHSMLHFGRLNWARGGYSPKKKTYSLLNMAARSLHKFLPVYSSRWCQFVDLLS